MEVEPQPRLSEASPPLSQEEQEILARSKRKMKRIRLPYTEGDDLEPENGIPETNTAKLNGCEQPRISYKDKMTRVSVLKDDWNDWSDSDEDADLIPDFNAIPDPISEPVQGPNARFTREEK